MPNRNNIFIVGDIGGTNARFAAFETSPELRMLRKVSFHSDDSDSFDALLEKLAQSELKEAFSHAERFVFAVAGPVVDGTRARLPNVDWPVDITAARQRYGEDRVILINDFVAQAFAVKTSVVASAAAPIKPGEAEPDGLVAVLGAGTGLGHCSILTAPSGQLIAVPSEASHQAFAFRDDEREFETFARRALNVPYVTPDLIVCGRGLSLLHAFFNNNEELEPRDVAARLKDDDDDDGSPVLRQFARFYGRACRHYALAVLPTGGIYVAGGVAARNPILVTTPAFTEEFLDAIMHRKVLEQMPIWLNAEQDSGLWGAAQYGLVAARSS